MKSVVTSSASNRDLEVWFGAVAGTMGWNQFRHELEDIFCVATKIHVDIVPDDGGSRLDVTVSAPSIDLACLHRERERYCRTLRETLRSLWEALTINIAEFRDEKPPTATKLLEKLDETNQKVADLTEIIRCLFRIREEENRRRGGMARSRVEQLRKDFLTLLGQ